MIARIQSVVLDCPDASGLAGFYSALTGLPRTVDEPDWVVIGERGSWRLAFQQIDTYVPPRWPDPTAPQQFHLDFRVDDVDAAETEALKLGARRLPGGSTDDEEDNFRVYADPAGHPFCLCW